MSTATPPLPEKPSGSRLEDIRAQLARLERRDWWLWAMAATVMLMLTLAVMSLSFPELFKFDDPFFQFSLSQAVRGLTGLVLIFNAYTIYQQVLIKRLRRQLSEQLGAMTQLQRHAEQFHRLATVDALTGLYNRRYAEQRLAREVINAERFGYPLTLVAFDLNDFKPINDRYGHPAGDMVLKEFGERLVTAVRVSDVAARMGGDEFLAILPQCPLEQVPAMLARLARIEVLYEGQRILVGFSAGWVGFRSGETPAKLIERADQALYENKRASKRHLSPQALQAPLTHSVL